MRCFSSHCCLFCRRCKAFYSSGSASLLDWDLMHITQQSWREQLGGSWRVSSRAENTQGALWDNRSYLFDHQTAVSTCLSAQLLLNPELSRTGGQQINAEEPKSRHPFFFQERGIGSQRVNGICWRQIGCLAALAPGLSLRDFMKTRPGYFEGSQKVQMAEVSSATVGKTAAYLFALFGQLLYRFQPSPSCCWVFRASN